MYLSLWLVGLGASVPEFWKLLHAQSLSQSARLLEPTDLQRSWCGIWSHGTRNGWSWMDIQVYSIIGFMLHFWCSTCMHTWAQWKCLCVCGSLSASDVCISCLCLYFYLLVHVCLCLCVCVSVCMYLCMCLCLYLCVLVFFCVSVFVCVPMPVCVCVVMSVSVSHCFSIVLMCLLCFCPLKVYES